MKIASRFLYVAAGTLAVSVAYFALIGPPAITEGRGADAASVPRPTTARQAERIVGPGRIEPSSGEIDISALVGGTVQAVYVREGDQVVKNQPLAQIDDATYRSRLSQAKALLAAKKAALAKLNAGNREPEIDQALANIQEAESQQKLMADRYNRQRQLVNEGFGTTVALKEAQSSLQQATARLNAVKAAHKLAVQGARPEDIEVAKAEVLRAEAEVEEATLSFDRTTLRAPFAGTILRRYREPGMRISEQPPTPVLQIADMSVLWVRTQIDETDIARLVAGAAAEVRASAYPDKRFKGKVVRLSPRLGAKTITTDAPAEKRDARVLDALIELEPGSGLPAGLRVDVYIDAQPNQAALGNGSV